MLEKETERKDKQIVNLKLLTITFGERQLDISAFANSETYWDDSSCKLSRQRILRLFNPLF